MRPSITQVDGRIDEAVDGGTGPRPQSPPGPSAKKKIEPEISCEGLFLQQCCKKGISVYFCNTIAFSLPLLPPMNRKPFLHQASLGLLGFLLLWTSQTLAQGFEGYYQHPDLHGITLVFVYPFA